MAHFLLKKRTISNQLHLELLLPSCGIIQDPVFLNYTCTIWNINNWWLRNCRWWFQSWSDFATLLTLQHRRRRRLWRSCRRRHLWRCCRRRRYRTCPHRSSWSSDCHCWKPFERAFTQRSIKKSSTSSPLSCLVFHDAANLFLFVKRDLLTRRCQPGPAQRWTSIGSFRRKWQEALKRKSCGKKCSNHRTLRFL